MGEKDLLQIMKWKDKGNKIISWLRENYLKALLALNVVLLLCFALGYIEKISNLTEIEFSKQQIREYVDVNSIGGYIDKESASGLYDIIPDIFLEKGYYSYTIHYTGDSEESFCWPHTYVQYYDVIEQEIVYLGEGKSQGTKRFWLNADLNIALRLSYSGEGTICFNGFSIKETNVLAKIELFKQIILLLGANILVFLKIRFKKNPLQNRVVYVVISLMAITVVSGLLSMSGYILIGHDTRFHLARIEGIKEGLLAGQFPVRISPVFYNGYGYANSIFYGELFLYFPAVLRLIGFSVMDSYNAYLIVLNFFTAFISYYAGKKMFSNDAVAVTIAALYTLCPYRLIDMYTRSAIGEVTAIAFLPLVVYGVYHILTADYSEKSYKRAYVPLMLSLTGIIQSHILTVEMVALLIFMACVIFFFKALQKKRLLMLLKTAGMTLLLNLWFLVPFIDFTLTQNVKVFEGQDVELIQNTGLFFPQLFMLFSDYSQMSTNTSTGLKSEMTYSMGLSIGLGILLFFGMMMARKEETNYKIVRKQGICVMVLAVIAIWMTTVAFPWDRLSNMSSLAAKLITSLQFVWRFVGVAAALSVFVVGFGLVLLEKQEGKNTAVLAMAVLSVLALVSAMDFVQDNYFNRDKAYITENNLLFEENAYYAMNGEYTLPGHSYNVVTQYLEPRCFEGVSITGYEKQGTNISFRAESGDRGGYAYLPLLNYKGYKVSSEDGVITNKNLTTGENAVIRIDIPENFSGTVSVSYGGLWYWRVAELITLITIICLFGYKGRRKLSLTEGQGGDIVASIQKNKGFDEE